MYFCLENDHIRHIDYRGHRRANVFDGFPVTRVLSFCHTVLSSCPPLLLSPSPPVLLSYCPIFPPLLLSPTPQIILKISFCFPDPFTFSSRFRPLLLSTLSCRPYPVLLNLSSHSHHPAPGLLCLSSNNLCPSSFVLLILCSCSCPG